jgi:diguanylate cyclase (GGDEF)-like protein
LAALTVASLLAPAVLFIQTLRGNYRDAAVTAAASAVLFLLVATRMAGLVRALEAVLIQRRALEIELEHRAHHDDLTGLVNRRRFVEQLGQVLADRPGGGAQVLFIDLDRFKTVNDTLGHGAGDNLLVTAARRLTAVLDRKDTTARLGGDEFAVLLSAEPQRSAESVSEAIKEALGQPVPLQGLDLRILASIGTAEAKAEDTLEDLMHRADMAMYHQKKRVERRANRPAEPLPLHTPPTPTAEDPPITRPQHLT